MTDRHRSKEFLNCLKHVEKGTLKGLELHIILGSLSTQKTTVVMNWVDNNPRVHFHSTPTRSSWLNAVGGWFAQLEGRALY